MKSKKVRNIKVISQSGRNYKPCGPEYPGRHRDGYPQDGEIYREGLLYHCAGEGRGRVRCGMGEAEKRSRMDCVRFLREDIKGYGLGMKAVHGVSGAVDGLYFCGKLRKNLIYCHMLRGIMQTVALL